jgi:hypothetical protein
MDPISMVAAAAIAAAAFLAGRRSRRSASLPKDKKPTCTCTHSLAFHDPTSAQCHARVAGDPLHFDGLNRPIAWNKVQCTCRQYIGPIPPEQILASFLHVPALPDTSTSSAPPLPAHDND